MELEDKQRLAQEEEREARRLAIMTMKKRERYLYSKIMFGKRRKVREVSSCHLPDVATQLNFEASWALLRASFVLQLEFLSAECGDSCVPGNSA